MKPTRSSKDNTQLMKLTILGLLVCSGVVRENMMSYIATTNKHFDQVSTIFLQPKVAKQRERFFSSLQQLY